MSEQDGNPGVTAPPAEPVAPATPAQPTEPTGSEPVTNTGNEGSQAVPFDRFQEVNNSAKAEKERADALEAELEEFRNKPSTSAASEGDDIDPDIEAMLDAHAKRRGYLTQSEIQQREQAQQAQEQVKQDVRTLTEEYKESGIPFDDQAIMSFAKEKGIVVGSKEGLRSAYLAMNHQAIVDAERKRALDQFHSSGSSSAEKPGSTGGAPAPQEPKAHGIRGRVHAARERMN